MNNRYIRLFLKGIKSLRENGVKITWRKVKIKIYKYRLNRKTRFANRILAENPLFSEQQLQDQRKHVFSKTVKISIVVPLYNTPPDFLKQMIGSVTAQTYRNWELCMADGSDEEHGEVGRICREYADRDPRIKYKKLGKNLGISGNTNACIEMSTGEYIGLFDHDDILHPAALHEVMAAICEKNADFIYTDEATFKSPDINDITFAHFKPDFAVDNLWTNNYICHFTVFKKTLLEITGLFRPEYDGSQDHDLILRLTERAQTIVHIPKILYYWRAHPGSVAEDIGSKPYAVIAGRKAVRDSLERCGHKAEVVSTDICPTIYKVNFEILGQPRISIIIPTRNHLDDLKKCIASITALTTYQNYEIVIVDNGSDDKEVFEYYDRLRQDPRFVICSLDIEFNYPRLNNYAAGKASGEYYLFLNNDTEVITPNWIEEMLMYAQRSDIAAVGAKLYYPDDTIQHAGVILGIGEGEDKIAGHVFSKEAREFEGYMAFMMHVQNLSAVTAACMMVRAEVYNELGGFDEGFKVAFNDVDLCMRMRKAGYLIVWTPFAELYKHESKSRGYEDTPEKQQRFKSEADRFKLRWAKELAAGDPYYNPNLTLERDDFSLAVERF